MAFNFPSAPSAGQIYSPGAGLPSFQFNGVGWINLGAAMAVDTFAYTATGGETSVTVSGGYLANMGIVSRGGAVQAPGDDVDISSGSVLLFATALVAGESILFYKFRAFSLIDALTKSQNGADIPNKPAFRLNVGTDEPAALGIFFRATAPQGWLKANGAVVSRVTYADLDTAIYCGDGNNATAEWGYRTNSTDTLRSTTGTHVKLPDARGEFIRGWDDGRGVDAGRNIFLSQAQAIQSHTHGVNDPTHSHTYVGGGNAAGTGTAGAAGQSANAYLLSTLAATTGISIQSTGGPETRPRNLSPLICVKY
ncbi:MAG: phage tail protein [Burkholderiales bacterium]|nr:phage tail protein [Burkholderiales bacterium]